MDKKYFEDLANSINEPKENKINDTNPTATLTVKVDIDAKIYCDGDFLDLVEANVIKKIPIEVGQHLITIESENDESISEDREIDIKDAGKNYLLIVKGLLLKIEEKTKKQEEKKNAEKQRVEEEQKKYEDEKRQREEQQKREKEEWEKIVEENNPYYILVYNTVSDLFLKDLDVIFNTPILLHTKDPYDDRFKKVYFSKPINFIPDGAFAFDTCKDYIDFVHLPQGVEYIGEKAFCGQSRLNYVQMPDGIKEIGREAFKGCSSMENRAILNGCTLTLPTQLATIGAEAFSGCNGIQHIQFGESVVKLDERCFSGCEKLESIKLPDSLQEIGTGCFSGCTSLREVNLGKGIQKISTFAFEHCISLQLVVFRTFQCPQIGPDSFYDCGKFMAEFACKVDKDSYRVCKELDGRKHWGWYN